MVLDRVMSVTGLDWRELVAKGIARLSEELDSEKMVFEVMSDGVRISIVCSEGEKREAADLWENYVRPELEGDDNQ
jgi:hypothetical protein